MVFLHKLENRHLRKKSLLCLGLDPSADDITKFCESPHYQPSPNDNISTQLISYCQYLVNESKDYLLCIKPNLAFFIQFGFEGIKALKEIIEWIDEDIPVILDCKFGDISNTMSHYMKFVFDYIRADAVTINMYMGLDVLNAAVNTKISDKSSNSVFILASTSNPSGNAIQSACLNDMELYLHIIQQGDKFSIDNQIESSGETIGYVIGATKIDSIRRARMISNSWFLVPGVGTQGGDLSQVIKHGLRSDGKGLIISASRSISRSPNPRLAAKALLEEMQASINCQTTLIV